MKNRILMIALVLGLALLNPATGSACQKCKGGEKKTCKITKIKDQATLLWMHKDYLGLNEEQVSKLKDIKHKAIKDIIRAKAEVDVIKVDLKSALWKETINVPDVNKLIESKYTAKEKIAKIYVQAVSDMQMLLNENQRSKAFEMVVMAKMKGTCPIGDCKSCAGSGKTCPVTGKSLDGKGSPKGSMK